MNPRASLLAASIFLMFMWIEAAPAGAATSCEKLASLALPNAKIDSAQMVAAGAFVQPGRGQAANPYANLPAFCRVQATLTPSSDSDIKTEIWLPASGWNGKFEAVGNGGWAGTIPYPAIAAALSGGYAAAGSRNRPPRHKAHLPPGQSPETVGVRPSPRFQDDRHV